MSGLHNTAAVLQRRLGLASQRPAWPVRVLILLDVALGRLRPPAEAFVPRPWGLQPVYVRVHRRGEMPRQGGGL